MRLRFHCQNRIGILRDIVAHFADYGLNVAHGEVGGEHGNAIYLHVPNLLNAQLATLRPELEQVPGVFGVRRVSLMPSERRHLELDALLSSLSDPVMSIDMEGHLVAANRAAGQLLGVRVDEVPGLSLDRYLPDLDLPALIRRNNARVNGLRIRLHEATYLADIAPLHRENLEDVASLAGAVVTLHRADRIGERIYQVQRQELRGFESLFQSSPRLEALIREARRMAPLDAPLLIQGETGTGKELLARACHLASARGQAPFMALNCAGLPESMAETELFGYAPGAFEGARPEGKLGLLELTAGGTIFLDEVGETSPRMQVKLLRFLQDGGFRRVGSDEETYLDVRVICATQQDLPSLCSAGRFRQDLYHRLNVLTLTVPPLRDCLDGIEALAGHFVDRAARQIGCPLPTLSPAAVARLCAYHWPGNVRQLENVLFQAVSLCEGGTIEPGQLRLPDVGQAPGLSGIDLDGSLADILGEVERRVLATLYPQNPSSRQLAKRLGVSHTTIANKLKRHGIGGGEEA
ncbi:sigma-54-dependent transcriptional regulator [Halomonas caseinilytica]|uniref:HTH-type transcriptional regulatory protein TyrR n=1 Tax=Halomonas caseinilytica TaxID=438744 RepID=A0A1M6U5Q7_9GAMM|nr:sigma-54-dependent transcriptional regulator [Halomonas caseinilytica]SEM93897.1 transcriptional regulator of aroF, aroG, tyrA and aromatic amino acid transport [Halomonas caseinilytica]SHK64506.1 transcriptional regulator of aroF, aroG, tyrA and aromatic amino acid transport [Halomonas caseinilytica]